MQATMAGAERPTTSVEPRDLALREVAASPWTRQRELVRRLHAQTGLAESTLNLLLPRMEAAGDLRSRLEGGFKTYALPEPEPAQPDPPAQRPAKPATKPGWPFAAVVASVLAVAVVFAVVLSPEKRDPFTGSSEPVPVASPPPAKQREPAPPSEPAPADEPPTGKPRARPKPKARARQKARAKPRPAGLAAAKKARTAVLSGVGQPGAAAKEGKRLKAKGFRVGSVANAPRPVERSAVLYALGSRSAAKALAKRAGIGSVRAVDPATAAVARGSKLYVVVGVKR